MRSMHRPRRVGGLQRRAPDAEMQARHIQRHIHVQAEWQPHAYIARADRLGLLDMRDAIHHQRDVRAVRCRPRHRRQIIAMPDGIADQQIVECPAGQLDRLTRREAHQPAKPGSAARMRRSAATLRTDLEATRTCLLPDLPTTARMFLSKRSRSSQANGMVCPANARR